MLGANEQQAGIAGMGGDMAVRMYLVHLVESAEADDLERMALADAIHAVGGFVLMATSGGSLIAAFDETWQTRIERHRAVKFCGGIQLDPNGEAADRLRKLFAHNVAQQLAGRTSGHEPERRAGLYPAGYRPLDWRARSAEILSQD